MEKVGHMHKQTQNLTFSDKGKEISVSFWTVKNLHYISFTNSFTYKQR